MSTKSLLLVDFFTRLREGGLSIGLEEYLLLVKALALGYGTADRAAFARLCKAVWVKTADESRLLDYHIDQTDLGLSSIQPKPSSNDSSKFPEQETDFAIAQEPQDLGNRPLSRSIEKTQTTASLKLDNSTPGYIFGTEDEVQVAQAMRTVGIDNELVPRQFLESSEYFPVTRRQMKQSLRYLRRMRRSGPATELAIEDTLAKLGREGILLDPILVARRFNHAQLVLLVDQEGSMVPFHGLSKRLVETAIRGSRLGKIAAYYFHNCPVKYLYTDAILQEYASISQILKSLHADCSVLIFSDAGAARGGWNHERIDMTYFFLKQLRHHVRHVAWVNPMPRSRWTGNTSEEISRLIPMFEFSRRGFDSAIDTLRGRMIGI